MMTVTRLPLSKSRSRDIIHLEDYILYGFERFVLCENARVLERIASQDPSYCMCFICPLVF